MNDCVFCKIIAKTIPSTPVYEDKDVYAFLDIYPVKTGHVLVVPKVHADTLPDLAEEPLTKTILAVQKIGAAVMKGVGADGFNVIQNNGRVSGQTVFHVHIHIVPRSSDDGLSLWPPGPGYASDLEAQNVAERIQLALEQV